MPAGHDCCAVMQSCDATMTSSCCKLAPRINTPGMVSEYSPEHHRYALPAQAFFLPLLTDSGTHQFASQSASAPDTSPGHFPVLRI